jgi:hypothetical protein
MLKLPRTTLVPTLTLVTCYPFDALLPGGPLRYGRGPKRLKGRSASPGDSARYPPPAPVGPTFGPGPLKIGTVSASPPCLAGQIAVVHGMLLPVRYCLPW